MKRTEAAELTNLCMVCDGSKVLLQRCNKPGWTGYALPGGHVEPEESFVEAVIREVREETGLEIARPKLCGVKQFCSDSRRYIVFLFKAWEFSGCLTDSLEGHVEWVERSQIPELETVPDFAELMRVMDEDLLTEFQYIPGEAGWVPVLR